MMILVNNYDLIYIFTLVEPISNFNAFCPTASKEKITLNHYLLQFLMHSKFPGILAETLFYGEKASYLLAAVWRWFSERDQPSISGVQPNDKTQNIILW